MYLEIFLVDFAVFRVFLGISRDFAGPQPHEISEALAFVVYLGTGMDQNHSIGIPNFKVSLMKFLRIFFFSVYRLQECSIFCWIKNSIIIV